MDAHSLIPTLLPQGEKGANTKLDRFPLPLGEGQGRLLELGFAMPAPTYSPIFFLVTLVGMASSGLSGQ